MKKLQLKKLGDKALFQFNKRSKVVWQIQNKFKEAGVWYATITATISGITKCKRLSTEVWCKD